MTLWSCVFLKYLWLANWLIVQIFGFSESYYPASTFFFFFCFLLQGREPSIKLEDVMLSFLPVGWFVSLQDYGKLHDRFP